jgi:hypothetical protein
VPSRGPSSDTKPKRWIKTPKLSQTVLSSNFVSLNCLSWQALYINWRLIGGSLAGVGRRWQALAGVGRRWQVLAGARRHHISIGGSLVLTGRHWQALAGTGSYHISTAAHWQALACIGRRWQSKKSLAAFHFADETGFRRDERRNKEVYTCDRAGQYKPGGKGSHVDPSISSVITLVQRSVAVW